MGFSQGILLAATAVVTLVFGFMVARRAKLPPLPAWSWRNIIALISLIATIAGAAIITVLIWSIVIILTDDADRLIGELVRDPRARPEVGQVLVKIYETISSNLIVLTIGLLVILVGFGFAITARKFEGELFGNKLSWGGGENEPPPVPVKVVNEADQAVPVEQTPPATEEWPPPPPR